MSLSRIGPAGQVGDSVELLEQATNDLVSVIAGAESIEILHHPGQRRLRLTDSALGVALSLLIEAALALDELLAVERGQGMKDRIARRTRVSQEARHPISRCQHIELPPVYRPLPGGVNATQ